MNFFSLCSKSTYKLYVPEYKLPPMFPEGNIGGNLYSGIYNLYVLLLHNEKKFIHNVYLKNSNKIIMTNNNLESLFLELRSNSVEISL